MDQEVRRTDRNGRLARLVRPNEYHRLGEQAHGEQYAYDLLGRLRAVTRPDGVLQARHTYNAWGYLASTTDTCGSGIRFTYDIGGRRTRAMTSAGSAQQYEYDAAGNITGVMTWSSAGIC